MKLFSKGRPGKKFQVGRCFRTATQPARLNDAMIRLHRLRGPIHASLISLTLHHRPQHPTTHTHPHPHTPTPTHPHPPPHTNPHTPTPTPTLTPTHPHPHPHPITPPVCTVQGKGRATWFPLRPKPDSTAIASCCPQNSQEHKKHDSFDFAFSIV